MDRIMPSARHYLSTPEDRMISWMNNAAVIVARGELTSALRQRFSFDRAVVVYSASEAPDALSTILQKRLPVVVLDRKFATSPGGAQFVADLRAVHPDAEIRILSDEGSEIPLVLRRPILDSGRATLTAGSQPLIGDLRRAPRFPVHAGCEAWVNGEPTALVDVSVAGAQVISPTVLRPSQSVRVALSDDADAIKVEAAVAWSAFERSKKTGATHYRAGVEFTDAEEKLLEAYCTRHGIQI
jgi:hypothetical protein